MQQYGFCAETRGDMWWMWVVFYSTARILLWIWSEEKNYCLIALRRIWLCVLEDVSISFVIDVLCSLHHTYIFLLFRPKSYKIKCVQQVHRMREEIAC